MRRRYTGLLQASWASRVVRCRLLLFWGVRTSGSPDGVRGSRGLLLSLRVSRDPDSLFPGVWRHFPARLKRVLLEASFPTDEISRLQVTSPGSTAWKVALPDRGFLNTSSLALRARSGSPFMSCGSEEATRARGPGTLWEGESGSSKDRGSET